MKAGKEHRVPLSEQALQILEGMGPRDAGAYVFKGRPSKGNTNTKLSNMAMNMIMRRMAYTDVEGRVCVPHGLRSTFRDWAGDCTAYPGTLSRRPLPMRWVTKRNAHTAGAMPWKDGAHLCRSGRSGATRRAALALVSLSHCALRKVFEFVQSARNPGKVHHTPDKAGVYKEKQHES